METQTLSRRGFGKGTLSSLLTFTLLETLFECDAFSAEVKPVAVGWLSDVNQLAQDLKDKKVSQQDWQKKIDELFAQANLPELLDLVDFDKLTKNIKLKNNGALSLRFGFQQIEGLPKDLVFGKQIFALKKGRSVVPHGHNNMATSFLILKGNFHGRHYDRLADESDHFLIKPTIDKKFGPGDHSSITDYNDNIHWFKAENEPAFIFNIHVIGLGENKKRTGRVYLDPNGDKVQGGLIRAPKLNHEKAHKLYG